FPPRPFRRRWWSKCSCSPPVGGGGLHSRPDLPVVGETVGAESIPAFLGPSLDKLAANTCRRGREQDTVAEEAGSDDEPGDIRRARAVVLTLGGPMDGGEARGNPPEEWRIVRGAGAGAGGGLVELKLGDRGDERLSVPQKLVDAARGHGVRAVLTLGSA